MQPASGHNPLAPGWFRLVAETSLGCRGAEARSPVRTAQAGGCGPPLGARGPPVPQDRAGRHIAFAVGSEPPALCLRPDPVCLAHSISRSRPVNLTWPGQWLPAAVGKPTMLTAPWLDVSTLSSRSCGQSWGPVGSPHRVPLASLGSVWKGLAPPSVMLGQMPLSRVLPRHTPSPGLELRLRGLCLCPEGTSAQGPRGDGFPQRASLFPEGMGGSGVTEPWDPSPRASPARHGPLWL